MQIEIDQGEAGAQPVMVLREPPVSHLVEAEDAFQDAEHMFLLSLLLSTELYSFVSLHSST
jgi:hypothetical protein